MSNNTQSVVEFANNPAALQKYGAALKQSPEEIANLQARLEGAKSILERMTMEQVQHMARTGEIPTMALSPREMESVKGGVAAHPSLYGFFCYLVIGDAAFSSYANY